jgi:outer membrane protein
MKRLHLVLIISAGVISGVDAQVRWDLRRCVEYAIANNISVQQADIEARRAELGLRQSQLNQYPSLSFSANTGLNSGRSIDPAATLIFRVQHSKWRDTLQLVCNTKYHRRKSI